MSDYLGMEDQMAADYANQKKDSAACPDGNTACDGSVLLHGEWCKRESAASTSIDTRSKYARYCIAVTETRIEHPEYRRGQAHFNVLYFGGFDPEYADAIRGTDLDPFHRDSQVEPLLLTLAERWRGQ